jgi:ACS family sodium-dependent inorganic phosphate cotransporter-like MFS transporter 6/7/8
MRNEGLTKRLTFACEQPEFDWKPGTIGVVDSSFFWGYLITQVPGGFLASKYAANK